MTDSATADHTAPEISSRRALFGAGVIGAALALAGSRSVAASSGLSEDDLAVAGFAISLELTARDLYDEAIAAGADDQLWATLREQHESYAQRLAGITGISANARNEAAFSALAGGFASSSPGAAAVELENVAAATHTELIGSVGDTEVARAMASIVSMESRHAAVLAQLSGQGDDLDALFTNAATALSPEG